MSESRNGINHHPRCKTVIKTSGARLLREILEFINYGAVAHVMKDRAKSGAIQANPMVRVRIGVKRNGFDKTIRKVRARETRKGGIQRPIQSKTAVLSFFGKTFSFGGEVKRALRAFLRSEFPGE